MNDKAYKTIQKPHSAELIIERSRFIGHCYEVDSEAGAKAFITKIRADHAQATHNCYAYRIGINIEPLEYYNDHGEPSGTAGKPILGAIQRLDLTNVVVVVTRYFGGKKLGVRGLIEAYGAAATVVLEQAGVIIRIPKFAVTLTYQYADHSLIQYRLQQIEAEIVNTGFTDIVSTDILVPEANRELFKSLINELPGIIYKPINE